MRKLFRILNNILMTIKDTVQLQHALNKGKQRSITIHVPKGIYFIGKALKIYEGTTLVLHPDAVLLRKGRDALIKNGSSLQKYHFYDGNGNIRIIGGTFDMNGDACPYNNTAMCLGHATNVEVGHVTIKNVVGGHGIDACGLNHAHIHHCQFLGFYDVNGNRFFSEAIQLDLFVKGAFPKFGANDGTITKNMVIEHCYFGSSHEGNMHSWNRAIGSHASRLNHFYENIVIRHNFFEGTKDYALTPLKGKHIQIYNNIFLNCAGGVRYLGVYKGKNMHSLDGTEAGKQGGYHFDVCHNIFKNCFKSDTLHIRSHQEAPHIDVNIINNTFLNHNQPIHLKGIKGLVISQNKNLPPLKKIHVQNQ